MGTGTRTLSFLTSYVYEMKLADANGDEFGILNLLCFDWIIYLFKAKLSFGFRFIFTGMIVPN